MFHLLNKSTELGLIFDWKKTVWEDTVGYAKQFRRDSEIYLMTVLSDIFGMIIDSEINVPSHANNVVDDINDTGKSYLKEKM